MPKPVFRSSSGSLPKSFEETISQSFSPDADEDDGDDILSIMDDHDLPTDPANVPDAPTSEEIVDDHPEPADRQQAVRAKKEAAVETQQKRTTFWSFTTIFLAIVLIAAVAVVGVLYYLSTLRASDGTFQ